MGIVGSPMVSKAPAAKRPPSLSSGWVLGSFDRALSVVYERATGISLKSVESVTRNNVQTSTITAPKIVNLNAGDKVMLRFTSDHRLKCG
ncbi:unnamed protein product [Cyprideis torosa]|uniref:Uncharacterized protein n=1 Tax=Cyprideis torosa TaxID=163714 RepID=A0A7R8WYB0_9CRUS|nr:unnamed protein product [Cyprideis torosa]CAG0909247.1 unnamed protein product [Cyprideis torosa]